MEATHVVNINAYHKLCIIHTHTHTYTYHNYINFYYMKFVPEFRGKNKHNCKRARYERQKKITFANNYNVIDYNTF